MKATQKRMLVVLPAILMLLAALLIPTAVALESEEAAPAVSIDMMTYGASAQTYFDYKTDRLANADFYQITVEGGSLSDGTTKGLYLSGETVTLNAPETNADGDPFSHWVNSAEETVATERTYALTVGEANETYTAVYSAVPKYLITVEGGVLTSDNESTSGYFREGETVEFTAPEEITMTTDAGEETVNFSHWENAAEEIIAETLTHTVTVGTTDATYTAVYDTPDSYFVFTKIMDSDLASDVGTYRIGALKETALPNKVVIPKTYNNIAVTQIGSFAYSNIAKILFFDNIGIIGENAFLGCSNLENVKIPNSVRHIRPNAFGGCTSFTNIALPDTITKIDRALFSGCTNLVNITIPNSITSIGNNAFYKCNNLTDVKIPDSVISIGDYAFDNCNSLIEITIPNNTTTIGSYVFRNCTNLSSVKLPNAISKISLYMFQWCENLSSISIPDSVTTIEGGAFSGCSLLNNVVIPEKVTYIGGYAFEYCSNLAIIVIPDSVASINNYAFDGCSNLDTIYYTGTAEEWANITIGSGNDPLTSATVYFYSETAPALNSEGTAYDGNYWYYDENGEPAIWVYAAE